MKLKVLVEFRDKNDHKTMYKVGQIIEVADHKRAANLVSRDICDFVDEPVQKPAKGKTTTQSANDKVSKKETVKDPAEGAAGDAPDGGSESDED
ncbi:MAG: hypothetical protein ACI3ZS_03350 [Candidatus Cryptobacteroides sp.]